MRVPETHLQQERGQSACRFEPASRQHDRGEACSSEAAANRGGWIRKASTHVSVLCDARQFVT